jgi:uronate dehydrogenase
MRKQTTVLLTGAAGIIGSAIRPHLRAAYENVRLLDIKPVPEPRDGEETVIADIRSLDAMRHAMAGIDCVVHLAGIPDEDAWPAIRDANIDGTFNTLEAARAGGVHRVILASSHHVIAFRKTGTPVGIDAPLSPTGLYGVSKAFGESLGRLYSLKFGLSVICLRISAFQPQPRDHRQLLIWISPRDMAQLVVRSIDAGEDVRFLTVFGVSGNDRNPYDRTGWDVLGYIPQDNSERFVGSSPNLQGEPMLPSDFYYGGELCVPDDKAVGSPPRVPSLNRGGLSG